MLLRIFALRVLPFFASAGLVSVASANCGGSTDSGGGPGGSAYTLDNICSITPAKLCGIEKPCCESSGVGYDDAGCLAKQLADCDANVAEVNAGKMTFDPTNIDACLADLAPIWDKCTPTFGDYVGIATTINLCATIWKGTLGEGASCERDAECKPSVDPNAFVTCAAGKCSTTSLLTAGATCSVGGSMRQLCGSGLYCDVTSVSPATGTCKSATAIGSPCDKSKAFDLECGLGNYCDKVAGVCTVGKVAGAACTPATTLECGSLVCTNDKCASLGSLAKPAECKGGGADAAAD